MTPEQAFLADIIAQPDDDAPRLIFADWLEEQGQGERAEFIRVQCRIAAPWSEETGECWQCNCRRRGTQHTNGPCRCRAEWKTLLHRERGFLAEDGGWGHRFTPDPIMEFARDWTFRRGFVEEIELRIDEWLGRSRELRAAAPLRTVRLTCGRATLHNALIRLAQDDEPGDNPVCGLHTLDLSRLTMDRFTLGKAMQQAYRPWRGLRKLILPNWASLPLNYRSQAIELWKKRVPSLQTVQFGSNVPTEEVTA